MHRNGPPGTFVATVRPCRGLDPGDGLQAHWPDPDARDAADLDACVARVAPVCAAAGFTLEDYQSDVFQQRVPFGWIGSAPAWDYLFYFGVPTG